MTGSSFGLFLFCGSKSVGLDQGPSMRFAMWQGDKDLLPFLEYHRSAVFKAAWPLLAINP